MSNAVVSSEPPSVPFHVISNCQDEEPNGPNFRHRVAAVRAEQGVSLRTISRRTGIEIRRLREQEDPRKDLLLSDLHCWQKALDVPLVDFLVDNQLGLSAPIHQRAQLVKIMKTVMAISEISSSTRVSRLVMMLREQLIQLMPELSEVSGWPNYGSRRPVESLGKIAEYPISCSSLGMDRGD